jgi:uncharacterized phage protein gp47/JayE
MPFTRPTLQAIIDRTQGDIKGSLGITTILRRSLLAALARAISGAAHQLHGHLVFISKQIFPDQAEVEFLERWASIYGLERNPATFAQIQIDVTFTAAATVSAGTIYQRTDQTEYTVNADIVAVGAGVVQGIVTASVAGSGPNIDDGETLSLQSPIANVDTDATVDSTVVEGEDEETDEALRQRLVDRIQQPPAGGKVSDYIAFAKDVSGVTRVWVLPDWLGPGTVGVSFVQDNDTPSIIPDAAEIALVQTSIDEQKPVTAGAVAIAPIENTTPMTISIFPNTADVRAAVEAELEDLFLRESQVKGAFQAVNLPVYTGKISLSRINEAISIAAGEQDHILTSPTVDPEPATDNGLLTLGTLTFNTLVP